MGLQIKIISIVLGCIFFLFVFRFIKRNKIHASFAAFWIFMCLFLISIPFFEFFYTWLAYSVIGINDARNIIYIGLIGFLLIYVFYLTYKISRMTDQIQELISFTAVMKNRIKKIEGE